MNQEGGFNRLVAQRMDCLADLLPSECNFRDWIKSLSRMRLIGISINIVMV